MRSQQAASRLCASENWPSQANRIELNTSRSCARDGSERIPLACCSREALSSAFPRRISEAATCNKAVCNSRLSDDLVAASAAFSAYQSCDMTSSKAWHIKFDSADHERLAML